MFPIGGRSWRVPPRGTQGGTIIPSDRSHVTAAKQLSLRGLKPAPGSLMEYIILNEAEANPYRRVTSIAFLKEGGASYDREKYAELLLEAAETILGVFGFNKERFKSQMELKPVKLMEVVKGVYYP